MSSDAAIVFAILGVSLYPLAMTVAIAASAAFVTPIFFPFSLG